MITNWMLEEREEGNNNHAQIATRATGKMGDTEKGKPRDVEIPSKQIHGARYSHLFNKHF